MIKISHWAVIGLVVGICVTPALGQAASAPSSGNVHAAPPMPPAPATSAAPAETFRIIPENQTEQWWVADSKNPAPRYPREAARYGMEGCIAIAFAIHADGSVTPVELLKSAWTVRKPGMSAEFSRRLIHSVAQWRFTPAPQNVSRAPLLTYTVTTFTLFPLGEPSASAQKTMTARMQAKCAVSNFAQDMQKLFGGPTSSSHAP
ncbi:MAG TPA: energy transducer TonB [Rhodanobacteraceae bacterium]|nr:energy transducer TonB [Rhodanobacteraceae bacterium]